MKFVNLAVLALSVLVAATSVAFCRDIYVAPNGNDQAAGTLAEPLQTLTAARDAARKQKASGMPKEGIRIILRGGVYRLSQPLELGPEDSGTPEQPIVWQAYEKEQPVLSGGKPLTGWEPHTHGIWKAPLHSADKVRQLYVNDRAASMAMYKKELHPLGRRGTFVTTGKEPWAADAGKSAEGLAFKTSEFPKIADPRDLELQQCRTWTIQRLTLAGVRTAKNKGQDEMIAIFAQPAGAIGEHLGWECGITPRPSWLYNAYEFLTEPGEFYFDRAKQVVYYMPRPGEDMTKATVIVPALEKLLVIHGPHRKHHVGDLQFKGLTFAHTRWGMMKLGDSHGALALQSNAMNVIFKNDGNWHSDPWGRYTIVDLPPSAVEVNGSERIAFYDNLFTLLGCMALNAENDVQQIDVVGNVFYEIEGSGVNVGHPHHVYIGKQNGDNEGLGPYHIDNRHDKWDETVEGLPKNVTVNNNLMRRVCTVWWEMSPITVYYGFHVTVNHNDLKDTPYNSITLGWGWAEFNGRESPEVFNGVIMPKKYHADTRKGLYPSHNQRYFKCNYNRVVNPYMWLNDTGALYFLGEFAVPANPPAKQTEYSEVIGNYLVAVTGHSKEGLLYTDEGAGFLIFKDNVLDGPPGFWRVCNRGADGRYKTVVDNFVADEEYKLPEKHDEGVIYADNTFVKRPDGPLKLSDWPPAAQRIIEAAGLEPKYRDLLDRVPVEDR